MATEIVSALASPDPGRRGTSPEARMRRALFRVLRWAEQQSGAGVASLSAGPLPLGELVVSGGRLCLAVPAGATASEEAGLDADLLPLIAEARAAGRFSGTVAAAGEPALSRVREALLRFTAANLLRLARPIGELPLGVSLRPARADYDERLTFSCCEVLAAALATLPLPRRSRAEELMRLADGATLLVLVRGHDRDEAPYPVVARGFETASLSMLIHLSRCAVELCAEGAGRPPRELRVITLAEPDGVWQFVEGRDLIVAMRSGVQEAGALLALAIRAVEGAG